MTIALVVLGILVLDALTFTLWFVSRPFWWLERLGKATLGLAGLARRVLATPRGPLVYWAGGRGPAVVLLHGINDQAGGWGKLARGLAPHCRLLVPDLPGHGQSAPAQGPLTIEDLLAGVDALLQAEVPGGGATLVGNSMGGFLAMVTAHRQPAQVAHVVLLNGAAVRADAGEAVELLPKSREEARASLDALTAAGGAKVPAFVLDDLVRRAPTSPLARLQAPPEPGPWLDGRLDEIAVPVTLIWGDRDRLMPVSYAESVARKLRRARVEVLEGCGHVPHRECPERVRTALEAALAAPPQGPWGAR